MKKIIVMLGICLALSAASQENKAGTMDSTANFYLGTYSTRLGHVDGAAKGITLWSLDTKSGAMTEKAGPWPIANSSHMCLGKDGRFLYSISEITEYKGKRDGYLTIFKVDEKTLELTEMTTVSSYGPGPAYLSLDQTGKFLLLANYVNGNIVIYPIQEDGMLGEATANIMHEGTGPNAGRQEGPHPHALVIGPNNKFVYSPDLGIDKIKVYAFNENTGTLTPRPDLDVTVAPGSGPRHFVFHPSGHYAYMTLELSSQVAAYRYEDGALTEIGIYRSLPENYDGDSTNAEVRITANGKFVYASNRGHNSVAAFQVNEKDGSLTRTQIISTEGEIPRNFGIDPSGSILVAGNQNSHTMISYAINQETGVLTPTGNQVDTRSPVLFCFH
jgi:6-phosphogluconolactonase